MYIKILTEIGNRKILKMTETVIDIEMADRRQHNRLPGEQTEETGAANRQMVMET